MKLYRVKVVRDTDALFEECNGKARPLTEAEYTENQYRACPDHWRAGSKVLDVSTSPNTVVCAECGRDSSTWADVPYSEYRAYYGNPKEHVYLGVVVQTLEGVEDWKTVTSLWHIDAMRNSPEADRKHRDKWLSVEEALALPEYLGYVAKEQLEEAGYDA